jgi:hypothetical protein
MSLEQWFLRWKTWKKHVSMQNVFLGKNSPPLWNQKKIGGKNTHLLGRVQIYEKSVQCGHSKLRMCMKSWQQLEVVKFNTLVETNKIHSKPPLFNSWFWKKPLILVSSFFVLGFIEPLVWFGEQFSSFIKPSTLQNLNSKLDSVQLHLHRTQLKINNYL